jgi:hypothetical protein
MKGVAKTIAALRVENRMLGERVSKIQQEYDELWKIMVTVVDACEDRELRLHKTHFLRFREEYRLERRWDEEAQEVVLKLKTITDEVGDEKKDPGDE